MGRGNWFPGRHDTPRSLVYVDLSSPDDTDWEDRREVWEAFEADMQAALPPSFHDVDHRDWQARMWRDTYGDRNDLVVAANKLLAVVIDQGAECAHQGVAICPLPLEGGGGVLAEYWYDIVAAKVWAKLHNLGYKLSVRSSAWTSEPYYSEVNQ